MAQPAIEFPSTVCFALSHSVCSIQAGEEVESHVLRGTSTEVSILGNCPLLGRPTANITGQVILPLKRYGLDACKSYGSTARLCDPHNHSTCVED
ncbi:hypothetical protein BD311DRAFT_763759, partial [Dichomitus squalens]